MITADRGITAYTERYLLARDVSTDYAAQVRKRIDAFCVWAGADVPIESVCCDLANEWLAELAQSGLDVWTLDGYRRALLCVWNDAYQSGWNENPPLRLRRFKKPRDIICAFTHSEIAALLAISATLAGKHADGNRRSDFWLAAIHSAYSTGPRRGDLLLWQLEQIAPDGTIEFVQHKTGYPQRGKLSADAIKFIHRLRSTTGRALPWPYNKNWFSETFGRIRAKAGVLRGSFKWIRRSAGSYAERDRRGDGAKLLGQRCDKVFRAHYEDLTITGHIPVEPPELPRAG